MLRPKRATKAIERFGATDGGDRERDDADDDDAPEDSRDDADQDGEAPRARVRAAPRKKAESSAPAASLCDLVNKLKSEPTSSATLLAVYVEAFRTRWSKPASLAAAKQELLELVFLVAGLLPEHLETLDFTSLDDEDGLHELMSVVEEELRARGKNLEDVDEPYYPLAFNDDEKDEDLHAASATSRLKRAHAAVWRALVANDGYADALWPEGGLVTVALDWLTQFSASKTRALRHTATHAALALLEGVGARATSLAALSEAATKESERARTLVASLKTAAERNSATKEADDFAATAASYETELAACDGAARSLFEGVVAVRYRDVCAGIRADTMIALGSLMAVAPARFLSNANLKYVGWLLHDDEPFVRLAATRALLFLYPPPGATLGGLSADAAHSRTEDFMTRFRRRVADMAAADADPRVARRAVALLHRALLAGQLTTDEISRARHAIWSTDESGAVESGSLLISVEADFHADGSGAEGAGARGGKAGAAAAAARAVRNKLTCLINIAASAAPDGCDWIFKLVRAVWGQPGAEFLSDWPAFAALLSAKDGHADELDERATVCALAMLAAALSLLSEQTDGGDEAAALAAASTALGPALADALGRHLGSAPLVPPLLGTLTRLDPAAAFSSSAGGGKTLASVLYALSRAVSQHSSFVELEALSKTLVHLAAGDYPRARDAAAAVTKLGATLSANAARLVSLKPTALTADARGELELSLRRLRALHSAAAGALPPGTLPELDPVDLIAAAGADKRAALMAHKLLGPLFRAARARGTSRGVRAVFEHTKKPRGEGADAAFLEALAPGVAEEALHLLGVAATAAVARAIAACKSLKKVATAAERSTAAATVTAAVVLRDATLGIATAAMTLAHPSTLKTLGLDDGAGADADADADADVDPPLLSPADAFASLALPATLTAAERVYVLRARAAGFSVLCIVGTACGRALATADGLGALAWSPSGATARYITAYLNEALKAPARDVCALAPFGGVEWGVSGGDESIFGVLEDAAGDADAEAEEAEDVDALEWTEVRDALTASGATAPDDKAARDALVAARARRLELRDSFTRKARADALLTPIAALSTALPDADRVGQQVVFRSMVEYNEAGEFGLEVVRAHAERLAAAGAGAGDGPAVVDGVRALIRMQLRCISDASKTHASILVDTRQKIAAAAAAPRDGAAADERAAALAELLGFQTGLRSMTASHVRMLCEKGKVARSVAANLATALHDAAKAALRAPASQEFVFIAIIGYVPHIGTKKDCVALGEKIAALVDVGGAASGLPPEEALKVHAADAWWEKICAREAQALALEDIAGVPVDDIRAYVPLAALRALLARGGSCSSSDVDKITSRVLKALCGPGVYDAPKAAAARGVDEEEEEAEEGGEGEGGDGDGGRAARIRSRGRRRAPAAERADEDADDVETPPKDAADADDDDDDDEDVAPTRKSKTRAGGRGGGAAALKKAAAAARESAAAADEQEDEDGDVAVRRTGTRSSFVPLSLTQTADTQGGRPARGISLTQSQAPGYNY